MVGDKGDQWTSCRMDQGLLALLGGGGSGELSQGVTRPMVSRRALKCRGCESKIVTRTQVGYRDSQTHSFACPVCDVQIEYVMDLDQKNIKLSYRQPTNADWVDDEEGAIKILTFSDANPVPVAVGPLTPFIATFGNFEDRDGYAQSEGLRQQFARVDYSYIERCAVHYERGNWELFDKASPPGDAGEASPRSRVIALYNALQGGMSNFTLTPRTVRDRVLQRFNFARSRRRDLIDQLADMYVSSGRMRKLWRELGSVRRAFVDCYNEGLHLVVQVRYWREELRDLSDLQVTIKHFDRFRQLYIDAFETLCRLLVLATLVESIIHRGCLDVVLRKRSLTVEEYEALPNGVKRDHFVKLAVGDLFSDVLDMKLRNGISHHQAHYDAGADEVVLYDTRQTGSVERRIGYTEFCDKVLQQVGALELAATYHHALHIQADGRLR